MVQISVEPPVILVGLFFMDIVRGLACCCPLSIKTKVLSLGISDLLIGGGGILVFVALNIIHSTNPNLIRDWRGVDNSMYFLGLLFLVGVLIVLAILLKNEWCLNIVIFLRCMWMIFWMGLSLFVVLWIFVIRSYYCYPFRTVILVLVLTANMLSQLYFIQVLLTFRSKKLIAAAGEDEERRGPIKLSPLSPETQI